MVGAAATPRSAATPCGACGSTSGPKSAFAPPGRASGIAASATRSPPRDEVDGCGARVAKESATAPPITTAIAAPATAFHPKRLTGAGEGTDGADESIDGGVCIMSPGAGANRTPPSPSERATRRATLRFTASGGSGAWRSTSMSSRRSGGRKGWPSSLIDLAASLGCAVRPRRTARAPSGGGSTSS
jgi:hypothetical protein